MSTVDHTGRDMDPMVYPAALSPWEEQQAFGRERPDDEDRGGCCEECGCEDELRGGHLCDYCAGVGAEEK